MAAGVTQVTLELRNLTMVRLLLAHAHAQAPSSSPWHYPQVELLHGINDGRHYHTDTLARLVRRRPGQCGSNLATGDSWPCSRRPPKSSQQSRSVGLLALVLRALPN